MNENLPIKDPVKFVGKLLELIKTRSEMIETVTVAVRTKDGFMATASNGENLGEAVYEFTCAINAIILGHFMKVAEIKSNDSDIEFRAGIPKYITKSNEPTDDL